MVEGKSRCLRGRKPSAQSLLCGFGQATGCSGVTLRDADSTVLGGSLGMSFFKLPTPGFLPGKSHGQRSLVSYRLTCCQKAGHDLATNQQHRMYRASQVAQVVKNLRATQETWV